MKTYIAWVSYKKETPNRGFWDQAFLEEVFSRQVWNPVRANEFEHVNSIGDVPRSADGCIVILPARHFAHEQWAFKLNDDLARFKWAIVMLVGDEESSFPAFQLKHPNMKLYIMMPNERKHDMPHRGLPNGYATDTHKWLTQFKEDQRNKTIDWFFAGQDTHERRHVFVEYARAIGGMPDSSFGTGGVLITSDGFTKGLPQEKYYELMAKSKIIPCPSGAAAPDSFRVYEALEAGCVPLVDNVYTWYDFVDTKSYWKFIFGEHPLPTVDEWRAFPRMLLEQLESWPANANKIGSWWQRWKRNLVYQIENDINNLRGSVPEVASLKDKITVIVSSSPIPSHPSAEIIKETIASVRTHLPECEILIMQDGVRPEQEHMRAAYEQYKQELSWLCRNEYKNVAPIFFEEFLHQAEMTRRTLDHIKTPLLLFVEHDCPLCDNQKIEWDGIVKTIESGWAELIRFHHLDHGFIHPEHMSLMIDKCRQDVCGIQCMRTLQYSQRPHISTVDMYRRMLSEFSAGCRTFIEDKSYEMFYSNRVPFKLAIYTPDGHIKRSRDLNGRDGGPKYDDRLIF